MKKIGLDLDGVICLIPKTIEKIWNSGALAQFFLRGMMTVPQLRWFYNRYLRKVNEEIREFIDYLRENGWEIYIVSLNYQGCRRELERWLKINEIYYDKMFLYWGIKERTEWKSYICQKYKINLFIDDIKDFVELINRVTETKAILYNGERFDQLVKMIK